MSKKILLYLVVVIVGAMLFNFAPSKFPADDGFFYLQIANNISEGNGSSFHSISETNGYHPLWMLICSFAAIINPLGKEFLLHIVWFIQLMLFILTVFILRKINTQNDYFISLFFLSFIFIGLGTVYLSEAFLLLFLLSLFLIHLKVEDGIFQIDNYFLSGFLSSLVFLARLDSIFILFSLHFYYLFIKNRFRLINVIKTFLGGAILSFPYILWNKIKFGHFVPISGMSKSHFPNFNFAFDYFGTMCILVLSIQFVYYLFHKDAQDRKMITFLVLGALLHLLYTFLYQDQSSSWYWVGAYLSISIFINEIIGRVFASKSFFIKNVGHFICILAVIANLLFPYLKLNYNFSISNIIRRNFDLVKTPQCPIKLFAKKLSGKIPSGDFSVMVFDAPGKTAFYSDLSIISTDGLVNSSDYNYLLETEGIYSYCIKNKIKYILTPYTLDNSFYHPMVLNMEFKNDNDISIAQIYSPINRVKCGGFKWANSKRIHLFVSPLSTWIDRYTHMALWAIEDAEEAGNYNLSDGDI